MISDSLPGAFDFGVDWLRLLRTCCAIESRQALQLHDEAMSRPAPAPRTPEDIALERCHSANLERS